MKNNELRGPFCDTKYNEGGRRVTIIIIRQFNVNKNILLRNVINLIIYNNFLSDIFSYKTCDNFQLNKKKNRIVRLQNVNNCVILRVKYL